MSTGVAVPTLECPFPLRVHPDVTAIEERSRQWVAAHQLLASEREADLVAGWRVGWLASAACEPCSREVIQAMSDWLHWILAIDDLYMDERRADHDVWSACRQLLLCSRCLDDPEQPLTTTNPNLRAWQDLCRRLRTVFTAEQYLFYQHQVRELFIGFAANVTSRASADTTVTVDDYLAIRDYDGSAVCIFSFLLPDTGLPGSVWCEPDMQRLLRAAGDVIAYTNDLFSYAKEQREVRPAILPAVLATHHGVGLDQGMALAAAHVHARYDRFAELADAFRRRGDTTISKFVTRVEGYLAGHHHWYAISTRYSADSEAAQWTP